MTSASPPLPLAYPDFVRSRFNALSSFPEAVHHATTGLIGETVELLYATGPSNTLEELGDIEFYFTALHNLLDPPLTSPHASADSPRSYPNLLARLLYLSNELLDLSKKVWVYKQAFSSLKPFFLSTLTDYGSELRQLYAHHQTSCEAIRELNTQKLRRRYPHGYTDIAAQLRADKNLETPL